KRLGETGIGHPLPAEEWLPAVGQAAILVECRADDEDTRGLLAAIDHTSSRAAVTAERTLLAALGGNCHSPVAVLTNTIGSKLVMRASLFSRDGAERVDGDLSFATSDGTGPSRLARMLLERAGPAIAV